MEATEHDFITTTSPSMPSESLFVKKVTNLAEGIVNKEYLVKAVQTDGDEEMSRFLFSLGCYEGQTVTVISRLHGNVIVAIKDARYSIDEDLARAILV